uniref:Uncharacterized protein n=1 Tax=Anguilla anguilla TaxID=7936 RepID=A0A0E9XFW0_ANGAN
MGKDRKISEWNLTKQQKQSNQERQIQKKKLTNQHCSHK